MIPSYNLGATTLLPFVVFIITFISTRSLIRALSNRAIFDTPNHRSSHEIPTPRGGGIAILSALLPAWFIISLVFPGSHGAVSAIILIALLLAAVSWIDDLREIGQVSRFAIHIVCVASALLFAPLGGPIFAGHFPPAIDLFLTALIWVWFINLFNFMDGIDGMAGVQTASIGIGLSLTSMLGEFKEARLAFGLTLAAAAFGFLRWNWHPARIFLGDVGSIPLGFLIGWLLLFLASEGQPLPALILPLYFIVDASITLVRRMSRREKIWQAHREHFYQLAVQRGMSHDQVSSIVAILNMVLIALALVSIRGFRIEALFGAFIAVLLSILFMSKAWPKV
ncbi:MAG: glycosyl transferase [Magnetovibrio sp.]|nr:glycosyl transferase [Magnetovibrio sp.]|tara:strand:+ start:967 stop:1980 length:1014 start_codon:yes stop_codon:yes gene_type:complete